MTRTRTLKTSVTSLIVALLLLCTLIGVIPGAAITASAATPTLPETEYVSPTSPTQPTPYDGVPVTPGKINSSNYRSYGLTDDNWKQYNGYYAIRDAKELYGFAEVFNTLPKQAVSSKNVMGVVVNAVLLSDIVINTSVDPSSNPYFWTPLGFNDNEKTMFSGVFDGNGYSISGFYQDYTGTKMQNPGIFAAVGCATVKNLVIKNSTFYAGIYQGGVISRYINASTLEGIRIEESVTLFADESSSGFVELEYYYEAYDYAPLAKNVYVGTNISDNGDVDDTGIIASEINSPTYFENVYYKPGSNRPFGDIYVTEQAGHYAPISSSNDAHVCAPIVHNQVNGTCERTGLSAYTFCAVCEKILSGEKTVLYGHNSDEFFYTINKTDELKHDKRYMCCTEIVETVDHTFDNEICTVCDYEMFSREGNIASPKAKNLVLTSDVTVENGDTLSIPSGYTLTVSEGVTLTINGDLINVGKLINNGATIVKGAYSGIGTVTCGENATHHPSFNADGFCKFCGDEDYPEEAPLVDGYYQIGNAGQLMWFSSFVSKGNTTANAKLTTDIIFNDGDLPGLNGETNGYRLWVPIGMTMNHDTGIDTFVTYTGTFDGDGHTISGLYHFDYWSYAGYAGLISKLGEGGVIKNVTVKNSYFATSSYVGAILGDNLGGTVENCHNVNTTIASAARAGGIVGHISSGTVRYCTNSGTVKMFKVNPDLDFLFEAFGGIAGNTSGILEYCTNNGTVTGESMSTAGGISGQVYQGIVRNNVNNGNVTVKSSGTNFGGITGYQYHSTLSYNINYGTVTAPGNLVGGVIGNPLGNGGRYTHNYTVGGNACGVSDRDGCYSITESELANGRLAFELGIGQELGKDARPYVGGPAVYAYFNEGGVVNYTNNANYTCHHAGGTATCDARAVCDGCRNPYGEIPEGAHKFWITGREDMPNCTVCGGRCGVVAPHNGNYTDYCAVCGDWIGPELAEDGFYEIETFGNLMWFAEQVNAGNYALNARLTKNISASPTFRSYDWKPIAGSSISDTSIGYEGVFDGQGYTIALFPKAMTPQYDGAVLGLFGTLKSGAVVKNLSISNRVEYTFTSRGANYTYGGEYTVYVGMIAGRVLEGATVSGCRVANGTISISNGVLGAIVGINYGTVENCVSYGMTLTGPEGRVGGIVGDYNGGTLINCYTTYASLGSTASGYVGTATDSEAGVSDSRMASGEITYKMNSYVGEHDFWYQIIGSGGPTKQSEYTVIGKIVYGYDFGVTTLYSKNESKFSLVQSLIIASGETFTIPVGMTLEIPEGVTLTNSGTLVKNGSLIGKGTLNGFGSFIITEINPDILPTINDMVYDGNSHTNDVVTAVSTAFSALGKTFTPQGFTFYKNFTEVKDVGDYEIGYLSENERFVVSFRVIPLAVEDGNLSLEYTEVLYNGQEYQPEALLAGFDISLGKDYLITCKNNRSAGTATATIEFRGNFYGEFTREFTIKPVVIGESAIASSAESVAFTGLELDPVTITVNGVLLLRDVDYTVTYTNNIYPGTATATVVGIGNVSGEASFTFTITRPAFSITVFDQVLPYNQDLNVKLFDNTMYEGEGLLDGHTVVLGEPLGSGMITVLQILDTNGVDVMEYYDLTVLATGKYHMFYQTYRYDSDGHHWRDCVYNCDEVTDYGTHIGEPATCVDHSPCTLCDAYYQFATGIHTWVDSTCSVCGTTNPYEVWIDSDGNGQFNGDEVGKSNLVWVLEYGESGTYKLSRDVSEYVGGIGLNTNQNIVIDLNGYTLTITGHMALQYENTTITFIDSSPTKSGKIVGTGNTAIWLTHATAKIILDGIAVEGKVTMWGGTVEFTNGATATTTSMQNGTLKLYDGYDLSTVTVNPESDGTYPSKVYIGDTLMAINTETGAIECSADHVWVDADCTTAKHCTVCSKTDGDPLGHNTGGPATCESDEYCDRCDTVINAAIGHSVKILDAVEPTCDTVGYTQGSCCANCGETYVPQEEISALGHTELEPVQEYVVDPTCTSIGRYDLVVYCSVCDDELSRATVTTDALGHTEAKEISAESKPRCTVSGWIKYQYTCLNCGINRYETEYLDSTGHTTVPEDGAFSLPSCNSEGYTETIMRCLHCTSIIETIRETIPATEHAPNIDAATCTNRKYCTRCGITLEDVIGHSYVDTVTEATCYNSGGINHTCSVCNSGYFEETEPALGHAPNIEAPTCDEDQVCTRCDALLEYATGHSHVWATCTTPHYCSTCNETLGDALGHSFNIETPDCTRDKYCYNCDVREPALGHDPDKDAPTCTENVGCTRCPAVLGFATGHTYNNDGATCTEDYYCTTCNEVFATATGHKPSYSTTQCEIDNTCSLCGILIEAAAGHKYEKHTLREDNCVNGGSFYYTCTVCYDSYEENTDPIDHDIKVSDPTPSTCTQQGREGNTYCDSCGQIFSVGGPLPLADHVDNNSDGSCDACGQTQTCFHSWGDGWISLDPTCTEAGERSFVCSLCGETKTEAIDANGHSYTATVNAPTCTVDGYTTYTCTCGDSYTADETVAPGHSWNEGSVTTQPTCTEQGSVVYTCTVCGETRSDSISETGHNYAVTVIDPTCTENGYTVHECTCGDRYISNEIPEFGHSWIEATTESPKTCEICGATEGDNLPEKDPDPDPTPDPDPKPDPDPTPDPIPEKDHDECKEEANGWNNFWNAIINFFRRLLGLPEKCTCGEEI